MDNELKHLASRLRRATTPEQVFGRLEGSREEKSKQAVKEYYRLAKIAHPDYHPEDTDLAVETFGALSDWWQRAQKELTEGTYGVVAGSHSTDHVQFHAGKHTYSIGRQFAQGEICCLYHCTRKDSNPEQSAFKIVVDPRDNDLVANEATVLRHLWGAKEWTKFRSYLPEIYDSFICRDSASALRQVNVLAFLGGFYSLNEVKKAYPDGVDPKDVAWMWRRLLVVLGLAHANRVIHGAVLPDHILIHPDLHGLVLVDWSSSFICNDPEGWDRRLRVVSRAYEPWYPPEVVQGDPFRPGADIYMAARCMVYLMGGNPLNGELPSHIPEALVRFFQGCSLPGPKRRPQDAWQLLEEFDALIQHLWGPRTFRPFHINPRDVFAYPYL